MTRSVGIYLFDEVEVLDFAGPFEVFSTATRVKERNHPGSPRAFEVFTIAVDPEIVTARGGLKVQAQYGIQNHPPLDVLVVPGGIVSAELPRAGVIAWIAQVAATTELTASVCTGAFLIAQAGLLAGKSATTHWEDIPELRVQFPDITVREETRWVDTGDVITAAGISAGIDMSLHLVARMESLELALATARQMEYDWQRADF